MTMKNIETKVYITSGPFRGQEGYLRTVSENGVEVEFPSGLTVEVLPEAVWVGPLPAGFFVGGAQKEEGKKAERQKAKEQQEAKARTEQEKQQVKLKVVDVQKVLEEERRARARADRRLRELVAMGALEIVQGSPRCSLCGMKLGGKKSLQIVQEYEGHRCSFPLEGRKAFEYWRRQRERGVVPFLEWTPYKQIIVGRKPLRTYCLAVLRGLGAHGKVTVLGRDYPKVVAAGELVGRVVPGVVVQRHKDGSVEVTEE